MTKARIAVIGAGMIGRTHINVLRQEHAEYELAGVADVSPAAEEEAKAQGYAYFSSVDELIDKTQPDGAVVAVPNKLHTAIGLKFIENGIPIIIEKPIADTVQEALRLVETAEAHGVPILTGHHRRHNPIMRGAAEIIHQGRLGRVVTAISIWLTHKPEGYHDPAWRREPGGGPVLINVIHEIDCLRMLCGEIETVHAHTSNAVRQFAVEDTVAAILHFKSGAIGTITLSDTVAAPWSWENTSGENPIFPVSGQECIMIGGTEGALSIPSLSLYSQQAGKQNWCDPLQHERISIERADPYTEQMRNFARVIRGTESPVLDGRSGTMTLAATIAIVRSAEAGRPVRVDDVLDGA